MLAYSGGADWKVFVWEARAYMLLADDLPGDGSKPWIWAKQEVLTSKPMGSAAKMDVKWFGSVGEKQGWQGRRTQRAE